MSEDIFTRNVPGMTAALRDRCVAVAGCGGLGSNAAVALARAGLGSLILVDHDRVEASDLNRQYFFQADIGKPKTEALAAILRAINPAIALETHREEVTPESVARLFGRADLLVEAFDRAENKKWLIEAWCAACPDRPIVCGNGVAGLGRSAALKLVRAGCCIYFCGDGVTDLSEGLCSARVAMVANMQANAVIELLLAGRAS